MDELRKAQELLESGRAHAAQIQGQINELEHQITTGGHSPAAADQIAELRPQLENALQAVTDHEAEVARLQEQEVNRRTQNQQKTPPPAPAHSPRPRPDPRKKHGH